MSNLCSVNHLRQYPAATLDPRTREILAEDLTDWMCEHKRIVATIGNKEGLIAFEEAFASDVADVQRCLAELESVK
jgi:hypothetical protein